ncbi:MAG TPA: dicarboxylate--CoA ligase PimA, partial [Alphaproteobacteria bacterium]|nr:dicarboxylate--CoA ligase PimA [Alphaproteobacteria bacterium]
DEKIEPRPVFDILNQSAARFPSHAAIDFFDKIITFKQLDELVNYFAQVLMNSGVKKGQKIGIYMPNCPYFVICYYAILKAGAVVVNYSPLYSESELKTQVDDSDTEILITLNLKLLYPKAESILKKNLEADGGLKKIIVADFTKYLPFPKNILFRLFKGKTLSKPAFNNKTIIDFDLLMNVITDIQPKFPDIHPDDTAVIQYTGGTTGVPKGAELTHANIYINTMQSKLFAIRVPDGEGATLTVLPLFHVFAMTTCMNLGLLCGHKLILHPRFEIKKVLQDIQKKKPTGMPGVASMYNAINNFPETKNFNLKSLKICVSGGGPLPLEIKKKFEALTGCSLVEGYGLTEASPVVSCNPPESFSKEGSIGLPFPNTEIFITDLNNPEKFLGVGERGELCIKGPQVMKGYYQRPDATLKCLEKGMLRTGDVATVDEDGFIFIVDRIKEMVIVGGFKVYPRNMEEIIYQHPSILECAVIGIPDEYSGQKTKVFVVFKQGMEISTEEMMAYFKEHLAKHEVPKEIEFRDSLPKSPIGKILKKELK